MTGVIIMMSGFIALGVLAVIFLFLYIKGLDDEE